MWPGELRINATIVLHWIPFQIGSVRLLCCPMLQVAPAQGWIHVVSQASLLFRSFVQGSSFLNQQCLKFSEWLKLRINKNVESEISKRMMIFWVNYPDKNGQICKPHSSMYPRHDTTRAVVSRSTRGGGTYSLWVEGPGFEHHQGEMVLESTYILYIIYIYISYIDICIHMWGKYKWEKGGWDVLHSVWFSEKPCSSVKSVRMTMHQHSKKGMYLCVKHLFSTGGWRGATSFSAFLRSCSSFFLAWPFWSWFLKNVQNALQTEKHIILSLAFCHPLASAALACFCAFKRACMAFLPCSCAARCSSRFSISLFSPAAKKSSNHWLSSFSLFS